MSANFEKFDKIIENINRYAKGHAPFDNEIQDREALRPADIITTDLLFEKLAKVVAYSQQARAVQVKSMLGAQHLSRALAGYCVSEAALLNPLDIVEEHWQNIKEIRKKTKIFHLIQMARELVGTPRGPGMGNFLAVSGLPRQIMVKVDIETFWSVFHVLRTRLDARDFPYIKAQTSLLHLLMELGYDCAKPDSGVLNAALGMGLIESFPDNQTSRRYDKACESVIRMIQDYGLDRGMRPAVVDWYMLIEGGQTGALAAVKGTGYKPVNGRKGRRATD